MKTLTSIAVGMIAAVAVALVTPILFAAPGAHGPNGEHIEISRDTAGTQHPRFEAATEQVELVGELQADGLRVYLHEFASNTPINDADMTLDYDGFNLSAAYDTEHGHYVIADAALVARLQQPGEHNLLLTVLSAQIADLVPASLIIAEQQAADQHGYDDHGHVPWGWLGALLVALVGGVWLGRTSKARAEVMA
ncbi:hypothetical protein [Pseudidiomarina mangrovi]|uniref:hypothetical protein n=1 Tax=Pseudidiomarina mangrovi TaxID=2487133 RepID=UPI000FCAB00D|nr:hypothetical protein [Pseudidiomarina mangrovi]